MIPSFLLTSAMSILLTSRFSASSTSLSSFYCSFFAPCGLFYRRLRGITCLCIWYSLSWISNNECVSATRIETSRIPSFLLFKVYTLMSFHLSSPSDFPALSSHSWDNICGFDNSVRRAAEDTFCSVYDSSITCRSVLGCKWRTDEKLDEAVCDPDSTDTNVLTCTMIETLPGFCYHDLINSSNAGLDMTNRPHR